MRWRGDQDGQNSSVSDPGHGTSVTSASAFAAAKVEDIMLRAFGWIILIIFIIGLLVVLGVFKAIF